MESNISKRSNSSTYLLEALDETKDEALGLYIVFKR